MSKPITPAWWLAASLAAALAVAGCGRQAVPAAGGDATAATQRVNAQFAKDLRLDNPQGFDRSGFLEMLAHTPIERLLEAMAAGLDGPAAEGKDLKINLVLSDTQESFVLWIENAMPHHKKAAPAADANATLTLTLTLTKAIFVKMMAGTAGVKDTLLPDELKVEGSRIYLVRFFTLIDKPTGSFAIVTK